MTDRGMFVIKNLIDLSLNDPVGCIFDIDCLPEVT